MERHDGALAVDLGCRRNDHELSLLVCVLEDDFGAVNVCLDRVNRLLDEQLDANGGGQMKDNIASIDEFCEQRLVTDGIDEIFETRLSLQMGDIFYRDGRQIVENYNLVPMSQ